MPLPSRSHSAAWARRNTASGNTAGPGEKFHVRVIIASVDATARDYLRVSSK